MIDLRFPFGGLSEFGSYSAQAPMTQDGAPTTASCVNVRAFDPRNGRLRGSQRCGHTRYVNAQHSGANPVQHITHITSTAAYTTSGSAAMRSQTAVAVSNGNVKTFSRNGSFTAATSGTTALSTTFPFVDSAELFGVLYFADGESVKKYTASSNTVATWTPSAGSLPGSGTDRHRLICTWRSRIVVSGLQSDPHNWFMSAIGNGLDWDYGVDPVTETMAVAGNNSSAGKAADIINTLIPYSDDLLLFGGDHTIWQMTNDPMAGGRIDRISDITGMAFGQSWCKDPGGLIYFFGSRGGLYVMSPGNLPIRLSDPVQERLMAINLSTSVVKLVWDDQFQAVMIYVTPLAGGTTTNYCYDTRNKAWWPDTFEDDDLFVTAVHAMDGDDPDDRVVLLGCRDGYIRAIDPSVSWDDQTLSYGIASSVYLGPMRSRSKLPIRASETRVTFGANTNANVDMSIHDGYTAEDALGSAATASWQTTTGDRYSERQRATGSTLYLKFSNTDEGKHWSFEEGYVQASELGTRARRTL
jgi:hypothetical protein